MTGSLITEDSLAKAMEILANTITDSKAGLIVAGDEVSFHEDKKNKKIVLPHGMTYPGARKILDRLEREAETEVQVTRSFKYRPWDGAYATLNVLSARYGIIFGETIDMGFWGKQPPMTRTINIAHNKTAQVPWGAVSLPSMPGLTVHLNGTQDRDYGIIFTLMTEGPKKYSVEVGELFDAIETYLQQHSIYRGKAVIGSDDPEFLDLTTFEADKIIFSDEVTATLEGTLWAPLKYTETLRQDKISLKRAVLAYGDYGTGKTSLGLIAAQTAVANGWTFISARPGQDKVEDVLRTARLYQPALVFVEDIDTQTSNGANTQDEVSAFLDAFDGITAKGGEIIAVMTSNHLDKIHKGMLRPGRLDAVIEIAALDRNGVERLIKVVLGKKIEENADYDAIYGAMVGFTPAFVRESLERAKTFAIARLEGKANYILTTVDLVNAAVSLHSQLEAINVATEGTTVPTVDIALKSAFRDVLSTAQFDGMQLDVPTVDLTRMATSNN